MSTAISNVLDFENWGGIGDAHLTNDITFDGSQTYTQNSSNLFALISGQIFDGKGYSITFNTSNTVYGLFKLSGGTVQHLIVVILNGTSLSSSCGWVAYGTTTTTVSGAHGTIYNVSVNNSGILGSNCGGFVGAYASVPSNGTSFVSSIDETYNLTIVDCQYYGPITGQCGGILGKFACNATGISDGASGGGVIRIENCYLNISMNGVGSGCIVSQYMAKNYLGDNNIIKKCIVIGTAISSSVGGFVGGNSYCDIENSYSLYSISNRTNSGGFYGINSYGTITTSYYLGDTIFSSSSNSFVAGSSSSSSGINIVNCVTSGSSFANNSSGITLTGNNLINYTTSTPNTSEPINSSFDTAIWNHSKTPPTLIAFHDTAKWDNYDVYNDVPTFVPSMDTYAQGDPHISALNGDVYDLDICGSFKLFDNNFETNRFVINGLIEGGDGMFNNNKYIRKVFIFVNNKKIFVDMGFRGKYVKIINNENFEIKEEIIEFNEEMLEFKKYAVAYCDNCKFKTKNVKKYKHNLEGHFVPKQIRNKIEIKISIPGDNSYKITLTNVKENNTNPCIVHINPSIVTNEQIQKYTGAYVRNENISNILLSDITDINCVR